MAVTNKWQGQVAIVALLTIGAALWAGILFVVIYLIASLVSWVS